MRQVISFCNDHAEGLAWADAANKICVAALKFALLATAAPVTKLSAA
jgi:hypothetical protein